MLRGVGVAGDYITGTVVKLEKEQLEQKEKFLNRTMKDIILVVPELSVSDVLELEQYPVVGIVAESGNSNTHVAIQIRKTSMAAVFSVPGCMEFVASGDQALLDGIKGDLIINPRKNTLEEYRLLRKKLEAEKSEMNALVGEETRTMDGLRVGLQGNVEDLNDVERLVSMNGDGIGLFRTEHLFTGRTIIPTEEEQYQVLAQAAEKMKGKPITVRTLDVGGDLSFISHRPFSEENPALGCRGIRFSLQRTDIFKTQCKAIYRASAHGKFRILLPMLSSIAELQRVRTMLELVREELEAAEIPFDKHVPIGVMIETPAAAWMADAFAREADFVSIGTNDLTQYMLAADRGNKLVKELYSHYDPSVLRAIRHIIRCCTKEHTPVNVCGEAASDERLIPLLLMMGLEDLSVNTSNMLSVRKKILELDLNRYRGMADAVENSVTTQEVISCIDAFYSMYE